VAAVIINLTKREVIRMALEKDAKSVCFDAMLEITKQAVLTGNQNAIPIRQSEAVSEFMQTTYDKLKEIFEDVMGGN
jgi:hypothetical protein